jgi:ATP-dependent helicase/DNAse subunit B
MRVLIYGPAGSGKTQKLLDEYLRLKRADIFREDVYYLVPTAEHADRIKDLVLQKINPLFKAHIQTFDELICGGQYLTPIAGQMLLQQICRRLAPRLLYFQDALHSPAFYSGLAELLSELKNYRVNIPEFLARLQNLNPAKSADLGLILAEYADCLRRAGLQDKAAVMENYRAPDTDLTVFIDGFMEFTPLQYAQIQKLAARPNNNIYVTATYPAGQIPAELHGQFLALGFAPEPALKYLRSAAADLQTFALHWQTAGSNKQIKDLQRQIEAQKTAGRNTGAARGLYPCANVTVLTAGNRLQEVEAIAREILKIKTPAVSWNDIAIILRGIGGYQFLFNEVFGHYHIPVEIHEGIAVRSNQFIGWLLSLREAGSDIGVLFSLLKSAYVPVDKAPVHALEFRLAENPEADVFTLLPALPEYAGRREFLELQAYLEKIAKYSAQLQNAGDFAELKAALTGFYADNDCAAALRRDSANPELKVTVQHSNRAYAKLLEILDALQKHRGELVFPPVELWEIFLHALQDKTSARKRNGEQVQVYDALSARQKDYRIVFLADLTLRSWPAGAGESLLLKDYEKEQLAPGLKRAPDKLRNEDLLFYLAFTRASQQIYLSCAQREAGGAQLKASPYLTAVRDFFRVKEITYTRSAVFSPDMQEPPLSRHEYEQTAIYRFFNRPDEERKSAREKDLDFISAVLRQKNSPPELHQFTPGSAAERQKLNQFSVTQLYTYSRCAFRFFCAAVLRLRGRPEDTLTMTMGLVMHKILEYYYQKHLMLKDLSARDCAAADPGRELDELTRRVWTEDFQAELRHILPGQAAAERKRISALLQRFIQQDLQLLPERGFWPAALEQKLQVSPDADTAYHFNGYTLTGIIDRVDTDQCGNFLIVDYKSSVLPALTPDKLDAGVLPQALIYALIYQELFGQKAAGAEYRSLKQNKSAGLYAADFPQLTKKDSARLPPEEFKKILAKIKKTLTAYFAAIQRGEFQRQNDPDCCADYCPAAEICRQAQCGAKI